MVPVLVQAHTNLLWRDEEPVVNSSREKQENIQEHVHGGEVMQDLDDRCPSTSPTTGLG